MKKKMIPVNSFDEIPTGMTDQESADFWETHDIGPRFPMVRMKMVDYIAREMAMRAKETPAKKPTNRKRTR